MSDWEHGEPGEVSVPRRKSVWNLLLVVFGVHSIGLTWWGLFHLVALAQAALAPQKRFPHNMSNLGQILMVLPLFLPSAAVGLAAANLRVWLIPAARAALEREARDRGEPDFRTATRQLGIAVLILAALALPLSLLGAIDPFQ